MTITTKLAIDMAKRQILEKVDAVQCDANTRAVAVTLTAGGLPWMPGDGLTVSVACKKPDRTSVWYDTLPDGTAACSIAGNVVTAILAPEVLTAAGQVQAAIVFQDESLNQLATFPFIIAVEDNPAAGSVISNNYYRLQNLAQINIAIDALSLTASSDLAAMADYGVKRCYRFVVEKGNISGSTGENQNGNTIMRTVLDTGTVYAPGDADTTMTLFNSSEGLYQWRAWEYDADGNFVKTYGWRTEEEYEFSLKAGYRYRFTFTSGNAVTDEALADLPAMVYYIIAGENEGKVYQQVREVGERTSVLEKKSKELAAEIPVVANKAAAVERSVASGDLEALADYGLKGFSRFTVEKGNISGSTGEDTTNNKIMRTAADTGTVYAPADADAVMTVFNNSDDVYQWRSFRYSADGTVKAYNWCTEEKYDFTLEQGCSYRFVFTRSDQSGITDDDLANLPAMVYYMIPGKNQSKLYQAVQDLQGRIVELETALPQTLMEALGGSRAEEVILTETIDLSISITKVQSFPVLFHLFAKYTGAEPTVRLYCSGAAAGLYTFGGENYYVSRQWRMPPLPWFTNRVRLVIEVPEGTTVYIRDFSMNYETSRNRADTGVTLYGHLGVGCVYPHNTNIGFTMAAMCGFPACITNIKLTKDDVLVCVHDTTIDATAHNLDGSELTETVAVADKTYEELLQYEYGSWKHVNFLGEKLPTLEEFLDVCAKTNMAPTFSIHPTLDEATWQRIKDMLVKRNLLNSCVVKAGGTDMLYPAFSVLGSSISRYVYDVPGTDVEDYITRMRGLFGDTSVKLVLEFNYKAFGSDDKLKAVCETAISSGFIVSLYNHAAKSSEWYRKMICMGVTEFTEDWNTSNGLDF